MFDSLWRLLFGPYSALDCCCASCITPADVEGGALFIDVESDCPTMECLGAEMEASGSGESATWTAASGCTVQAVMSCEGGAYNLRLEIPMCITLNMPGTLISGPGDPVAVYFPPVSFTGNMFCCSPGTFTVEATVTEP